MNNRHFFARWGLALYGLAAITGMIVGNALAGWARLMWPMSVVVMSIGVFLGLGGGWYIGMILARRARRRQLVALMMAHPAAAARLMARMEQVESEMKGN